MDSEKEKEIEKEFDEATKSYKKLIDDEDINFSDDHKKDVSTNKSGENKLKNLKSKKAFTILSIFIVTILLVFIVSTRKSERKFYK